MSFEEFEAQTYKEPWDNGVYIVNGDTPVVDIKHLRLLYDELYNVGELIVHRVGGQDAKWSDSQKLNLTYCISDNFGGNKSTIVAAFNNATNQWEEASNVNFIHVTSQDSNCTASNNNVVFDVRQVSGQPYLARAFFPNQSRSSRNVLIDTSAFGNTGWPLANIVAHELGHALGFRHEHTRPEAGTCFEDNNWRPLTPYDSASIMHYPQCNGSSNDLSMTNTDRNGAEALYGSPDGDPDPDPDPEPDPDPDPDGTPRSGSASGSVSTGQIIRYQGLSVLAGTEFRIVMTGNGDPDLYVRFGAQPTFSQWHCRPYLWGANESCTLTVPSGQTSAHIMIHGYSSGSYTINVDWVEP